jgi:phosphate transport system substrate-binding protein
VRLLAILVIGAALCLSVYFSPRLFTREEPPGYVRLKTGGTSVVAVIVDNRWRTVYRHEKGVQVDYESTGSTTGLARLIDKTYAIAFTHAPMSPVQREKARAAGGEVLHVPIVLCAVIPVYNVKELKDKPPLKFTGEVLADIYLGKIKTWNHPTLVELNKDVPLPPTPITVVHREDSSGTTLLFTDYLASASGEWRERFGTGKAELNWPVGEARPRNLGVAMHVNEKDGAIGYVDRLYASNDEIVLQYGAIQNRDKTAFVRAEAENMTAAAQGTLAEVPEDLTFDLINKPGKDSYPITGVIYAVCYRTQPDPTRKEVGEFLQWATHEGQGYAKKMDYAPLPAELVRRVDQRLQLLTAGP